MIIVMDYNNYTWDKGGAPRQRPNPKLRFKSEGIDGYLIEAVGRLAVISDYNSWLRSFLCAGGKPTHDYDYSWDLAEMYYVTNPKTASSLRNTNMYGADSRNFIIPKQYNYSTYAHKFDVGHNLVFGWEKGKPVSNDDHDVPVYSDTIDKIINQKKADKEYQKFITQAKKQASRIKPDAAYTVDEVLYLLDGLPDDFVVRGLRVTPE